VNRYNIKFRTEIIVSAREPVEAREKAFWELYDEMGKYEFCECEVPIRTIFKTETIKRRKKR
jgi:hypothetical protein